MSKQEKKQYLEIIIWINLIIGIYNLYGFVSINSYFNLIIGSLNIGAWVFNRHKLSQLNIQLGNSGFSHNNCAYYCKKNDSNCIADSNGLVKILSVKNVSSTYTLSGTLNLCYIPQHNFEEINVFALKFNSANHIGTMCANSEQILTKEQVIQLNITDLIKTHHYPNLQYTSYEVISLTYAPFGYSSKLFRIENLNFLPNCNVSVKAREYDDSIYEISVQQAAIVSGEPFNIEGINTPGTPSNLRVEGTLRGSVKLLWENSTTFDPVTDHTEIWMSADGARTEDDFKLVGTAFQGQTVWVQTEAESFSNEFCAAACS